MIGYLGFIFSDILAAAGFDETESPDVRHVQFEGILLFVLTTKYNVHCTGTLQRCCGTAVFSAAPSNGSS